MSTAREAKGKKALVLGLLVAALVAAGALLMAAKPAHTIDLIPVFTVNSTADEPDASAGDNSCATSGGACTLRAAIEEANANGTTAADLINFNIGGSGVKTISPSTSLPTITEPVVIDGYSEPGASKNTLAVGNDAVLLIRVDGLNASNNGLSIQAAGSVVRGLSITRFGASGVDIAGAAADNNTIEGNFVGITPGGQARGNGLGLSVRNGSSGNTIGGTSPGTRNIVSGNGPSSNLSGTGVAIYDIGTTGNKVMGNYIGTTKSGTANLGNTGRGMFVASSGNLIGDNDPSDGLTNAANIIAFNGSAGVDVFGTGSTGNTILRNSIFSNAGLGIDLGGNGVTPNDGPADADLGPNNLQNYPVITSAKTWRTATTIRGTLDSTKNGSFTIWYFSNPESTKEEGKKFIGFKNVTDTDGDGIMPFTFRPLNKVKVGLFVTATVTNDGGDTSEFSRARGVVRG